jgi:hypothetical protein
MRHIDPGAVPEGLPDLRASTCGACHRAEYEEWQLSTHARAWADDAQFQAELHKGRVAELDVSWLCVNCHTPLRPQLERLAGGLVDEHPGRPRYAENPFYDKDLQLEAITCATCHVRDGFVLGPRGDPAAPHPTRRDPEFLGAAVCTSCHEAQAFIDPTGYACFFSTGTEWAEGPWAAEGKACPDCHMPAVQRPLVDGGPPRDARRHWFGGSLIPKRPGDEAALAALREIYPDGLAVRWLELPGSLRRGEPALLSLEMANAHAGHKLPTGDPERFLLVRVELRDRTGTLLAEVQERIGMTMQWEPRPKVLEDRRLAPRETRTLTLAVPPPGPAVRGPLSLRVEASKWRISQENLDYHGLRGKTVPGRVFFESTTEIDLPD